MPRTLMLATAFLIVILAMPHMSANENLLRNPGFEKPGKGNVPESWQRQFNAKLSGPFRLVADAHTGQKAVCLMTEEFLVDWPQFIIQDVALPQGARACCFSVWARGQGRIRLAIQFRKNNKPLASRTRKTYWGGTYIIPQETEKVFGLGAVYRQYKVFAEIPVQAQVARVRISNNIGDLLTSNVWGTAVIDDAGLVLLERMPAASAGKNYAAIKKSRGKLPSLPGLHDIAPYARITADPPSLNPGALIDNNDETALTHMTGSERYGAVTLAFPRLFSIKSMRMRLRGNSRVIEIMGGDNASHHLRLLTRLQNLPAASGWIQVDLPDNTSGSITIRVIEGKGLIGYRQNRPFIDEAKIYVPAPQFRKNRALLLGASMFPPAPPLRKGLPMLVTAAAPMTLPPTAPETFSKIMCADLWMWGIPCTTRDAKITDYRAQETFRRTADACRRMGVDTIMVDLHVSCGKNILPWPSRVANGTDQNIFKAVVAALHAEGFKVTTELTSNLAPPFSRNRYLYPMEETSRYPNLEQKPSLLHADFYKQKWLAILKEALACGVDGLNICVDEHYYKGHFMETFPKDDPARKLYRKRFGHDLPQHEADSLAFRQWISMRHQGITDLFGFWCRQLKQVKPDLRIGSNFMNFNASCSFVAESGIPVDLLGRQGLDELGSDYMNPYGLSMLTAANGWRKSSMLYCGDWGPRLGKPRKPAIDFYGEIMWSLMYGLRSFGFWRYNYVVTSGHVEHVTRAFSMVRDLERLGVYNARPPGNIMLLTSRTSMDWWQVRAWWGRHDPLKWDRGNEGSRGWFADMAIFNLLQQNGYPFRRCFLDREDQLQDLQASRVIILPFAYSVSDSAARLVRAAVAQGSTLILLDNRQGETDQWGRARSKPAFADLVQSGKAILFTEDILFRGASKTFARKVLAKIDTLLGGNKILRLEHYGRRVDATVLRKSPDELFLFIINWEKDVTPVDLGLNLPKGNYEIRVRDQDRWYSASIRGNQKPGNELLKNFRFYLGYQKPYVLYMRRSRD